MYMQSESGLASERVWLDNGIVYPVFDETYYGLRPEAIESMWYMWYFTKEEKYKAMANLK